MKTFFCSVFALGLAITLSAQNSSPLVRNNNTGSPLRGEPLNDSEKYKNALAIYQKLVDSRGDRRYPAPKFVMSRATDEGTTMDYDSIEITLEEQAYDVCASFGADRDAALATMLGHELIHFYEKHGWRRSFVKAYQNLDIGMKLDSLQDKVREETQADYLGGFLAYSAGFGLFENGPKLIEGIYKTYKLPDNLSGYPSRQDREALSRQTQKKLQLLVDAFETANLMTAIGNYAEARMYYEYVLRDYQSREIFNNIGVMALLEVIQESDPKLSYPVELDLNTRSSRGGSGFAAKRDQLLRSAIQNFDAAISLDRDYAPAYLNKACAYALLGDLTRAQFYAETEAKQIAKTQSFAKTESDANILLGIVAYTRGDSLAARKFFEGELQKNPLADKNLRIILRKPEETIGDSPFAGLSKPEKIDDLSLSSFAAAPETDKDPPQKIGANLKLYQYHVPQKKSKVYICQNDLGDEAAFTFFHVTPAGYAGKTGKDLGLNAKREEVLAAYKAPTRIIQTPKGEMLVYKRSIFILNTEGKLVQWVNYITP